MVKPDNKWNPLLQEVCDPYPIPVFYLYPLGKQVFEARWPTNDQTVGLLYREVDGYYVLDLRRDDRRMGYVDELFATTLLNTLWFLNREWYDHIQRDLEVLNAQKIQ